MKYIALQSTYHEIQFSLVENNVIQNTKTCSKHEATEKFVITINNLLDENNTTLKDLSFIAVNQGPGPFTTLRVVAASINGLAYATGIPLVGVNTFQAMNYEYKNPECDTNVVLLNAFGNDLYYSITQNDTITQMGAEPIEAILEKTDPKQSIQFLGNGVLLCKDAIEKHCGEHAFFPTPMPEYSSIQAVADLGLQFYSEKKNVVDELLPLYIKKHPVQQSAAALSPSR